VHTTSANICITISFSRYSFKSKRKRNNNVNNGKICLELCMQLQGSEVVEFGSFQRFRIYTFKFEIIALLAWLLYTDLKGFFEI